MKETLLDWLGSFWKVLISPAPKTFLTEAKKADGKFVSALIWLIIYAIYLVVMLSIAAQGVISIATILMVLFLLPLGVVAFTSMLHFICQRMFWQKRYIYDRLFYITVSILLPVPIIFAPLSTLIPLDVFRILSFVLLFYQVVLLVIAVKAIAEIEFWQALVAVALSIVASIIIGMIIFILIVSTISPPGLNQN